MKKLHRPDFYGWSEFNPERNLDFHSYVWLSSQGNIAIDPLPMSRHDLVHLQSLGGVKHILISNSDHIRDAAQLAEIMGAETWGPLAESATFPLRCHHWLTTGDTSIPNIEVLAFEGSKTPGELAFIINKHTLVTGDLIRAHEGGKLCLLPDAKIKDKTLCLSSIRLLAHRTEIESVLPGDGWPIFRDGHRALRELVTSYAGA